MAAGGGKTRRPVRDGGYCSARKLLRRGSGGERAVSTLSNANKPREAGRTLICEVRGRGTRSRAGGRPYNKGSGAISKVCCGVRRLPFPRSCCSKCFPITGGRSEATTKKHCIVRWKRAGPVLDRHPHPYFAPNPPSRRRGRHFLLVSRGGN